MMNVVLLESMWEGFFPNCFDTNVFEELDFLRNTLREGGRDRGLFAPCRPRRCVLAGALSPSFVGLRPGRAPLIAELLWAALAITPHIWI